MNNESYCRFLEALLSGNRSNCSIEARKYYNNGNGIIDLYENVIKASLYKVGELWELNKISVAVEHMATSITESILNEFYAEIVSAEKTGKKILAGCVENEFHQVGIKMVSDIFEMNGWDAYFLGANTPTDDFLEFAKIIKPDIIALSLSIYSHMPVMLMMITKIRYYDPNIQILVGGQAFRHGGKEIINKFDNVHFLPDLRSVAQFIMEEE